MKLCFVTILEPVNLPETFRDALIWESTQKKTDDLKNDETEAGFTKTPSENEFF